MLFSGLLIAGLLGLNGCGGKDEAAAAGGRAGLPGGGCNCRSRPSPSSRRRSPPGCRRSAACAPTSRWWCGPKIAGRINRIHFTEGGRVAAGQPLFTLDGSLAQASLNEAAANLENSRRAASRAGQLTKDKLIAQADYDRARAALGVDQARVASARTALSKMTLRAPFSGQIGLREVSVGEFVNVGQDLVTLVRLDPIEVDFSVPENALAQLQNGQKLQRHRRCLPRRHLRRRRWWRSTRWSISNSRSAKLRAQIANPDGRLKPGQFAKLQLDTGTDSGDALLVPEQALMQDGDTRFVYTVVDGKAKKTVIKTGARVPGLVQVVEGLKAGDVVITAGQGKPMMHEGVGGDVAAAGGQCARCRWRWQGRARRSQAAGGGRRMPTARPSRRSNPFYPRSTGSAVGVRVRTRVRCVNLTPDPHPALHATFPRRAKEQHTRGPPWSCPTSPSAARSSRPSSTWSCCWSASSPTTASRSGRSRTSTRRSSRSTPTIPAPARR